MELTTRPARIVDPISYRVRPGCLQTIPVGPCLLERVDGRSIDIVWGEDGQRSAMLPVEAIEAARADGHLVVLD
ncbi:MAG: hypothetical protein EHM87_02015 [Burkholderiales bacterium]|nr:MAG: hypothetical protein EHM87_02015 [Burkholderiales bacterium]